MSFTFIDSDGLGGVSGPVNHIATPGVSVNVGDLVVVSVKWEVTDTTCTCSDGTSSLTQWAPGVVKNGGSADPFIDVFYILASVASGTNTVVYTATTGVNVQFLAIEAMVFTPSAAASLDGTAVAATGTGTSAASGNITTTGTDGCAFGIYGGFGATLTSPQINSVAAAHSQSTAGNDNLLYNITYASGFTGQATGSLSNNRWDLGVIAFKIGGGGGGGGIPAKIIFTHA